MMITAAVLAEICSALPLSGSIYIWAAESAGPKYARFFGFLVAWWSCTAWMTFTASNCQVLYFLHSVSRHSTGIVRQLRITSSHKWLFGTYTSLGVLAMITSNGAPLSGLSQKAASCCPWPSIIFLRGCTQQSSNLAYLSWCWTFSYALFGCPSVYITLMASAQPLTSSHPPVSELRFCLATID